MITGKKIMYAAVLPEKDVGKDLDWNTMGNIITKYLEDEVCYACKRKLPKLRKNLMREKKISVQ